MESIKPTPYTPAGFGGSEPTTPTTRGHAGAAPPGTVSPPSLRVARAAARSAVATRAVGAPSLPTDIWPTGEAGGVVGLAGRERTRARGRK